MLLFWVIVTIAHAKNIGLTDCGGLFLLHTNDYHFSLKHCSIKDTVFVHHKEFYGSYIKYHSHLRYSDGFDLIKKENLEIANVGFNEHFKYMSLGFEFSNMHVVKSNISIHSEDSLFNLGAKISRGSLNLGKIQFVSENNIISDINGIWEMYFLEKSFFTLFKFNNHKLEINNIFFKTSPKNQDNEYFIRDSISAFILNSKYSLGYKKSEFQIHYIFANANAYLYGLRNEDESIKRFMYLPLSANVNLLQIMINNENVKAHFDYANIKFNLKSNNERFYETFAPNRVLPASILKVLSFTFLQKNYRVDADIDSYGVLAGLSYEHFLGKKIFFIPRLKVDGYYANGLLNIQKNAETTKLFTFKNYKDDYTRELLSYGTILTFDLCLGLKNNTEIVLNFNVSQIIPFYFSFKKSSLNSESSDVLENENIELFRNGFSSHLGFIFRI